MNLNSLWLLGLEYKWRQHQVRPLLELDCHVDPRSLSVWHLLNVLIEVELHIALLNLRPKQGFDLGTVLTINYLESFLLTAARRV